MNLGTGSLMFLGMLLLVVAVASKFMDIVLLAPFINDYPTYLTAANTCFILAIAIDKFMQE